MRCWVRLRVRLFFVFIVVAPEARKKARPPLDERASS